MRPIIRNSSTSKCKKSIQNPLTTSSYLLTPQRMHICTKQVSFQQVVENHHRPCATAPQAKKYFTVSVNSSRSYLISTPSLEEVRMSSGSWPAIMIPSANVCIFFCSGPLRHPNGSVQYIIRRMWQVLRHCIHCTNKQAHEKKKLNREDSLLTDMRRPSSLIFNECFSHCPPNFFKVPIYKSESFGV